MPSLAEIGLNYFVPYLLNRIAASWNGDMANELRNLGLTTPQMRVLAVLSINSGLTINELSVLTVTEQSTMSRTLDMLEERELVRRRPRLKDMRVREVEITEEGRKVFENVWPVMFSRYEAMFKDIGEEEFSRFVATLHKVLRNIRLGNQEGSQ
ncbi:MAG: MarR family transcriptional regulator [Alphaproteobacteria bacterium]|nr:MarR family transcriptional regulator [Alphaproteobacteria bacterium]